MFYFIINVLFCFIFFFRQEDEDYVCSSNDENSDDSDCDRILDPKKLIFVRFPCQARFRTVDYSKERDNDTWDEEVNICLPGVDVVYIFIFELHKNRNKKGYLQK